MKLQLWGQTVASVLTDSSFEPSQRDLDAVEMWAGCKAVARAVAAKGEVAETVEIIDDADQQDLTTLGGFHYAVKLVMRVKLGGLLGMAPVCSSWVFANMSNTKRTKENPCGDRSYPQVVSGNLQAKVATFCLLLAHARGLYAFMENPASSMIFRYSPVELAMIYLTRIANGHIVISHACRFSEEPVGKRAKKPFKLFAIGSKPGWLSPLRKLCQCGDAGHNLLMRSVAGKVTGSSAAMKGSQHYSDNFGSAIVQAWHNARSELQLSHSSMPSAEAATSAEAASSAAPKAQLKAKTKLKATAKLTAKAASKKRPLEEDPDSWKRRDGFQEDHDSWKNREG